MVHFGKPPEATTTKQATNVKRNIIMLDRLVWILYE